MNSKLKYGLVTTAIWNINAFCMMLISSYIKGISCIDYFDDGTNGIGTTALFILWALIWFGIGYGMRREFLMKKSYYKSIFPNLNTTCFEKNFKSFFFLKYYLYLGIVFITAIPWYMLGYEKTRLNDLNRTDILLFIALFALSIFFFGRYILTKKRLMTR